MQYNNFVVKNMDESSGSSQSAIINIAINIFQNVGIRRWIEEIDILKNQQIYFQICKIIFPETMIHLFRLSQSHSLTTGQKIQGVIDLIAKIINNDLYHISGQSIAQGKIIHLKNFLQLLEALSNSMIAKDDVSEVCTAPQKNQSFTYDDHNKSYYTVIGNPREFGPICYQSSSLAGSEPRPYIRPDSSSESTTNDNPDPLPPKGDDKKKNSQTGPKTPPYLPSQPSRELPYPLPLHQKNRIQFEEQHRKWLAMVKGMNKTKINLEKQKMYEQQQSAQRWKMDHDYQVKRTEKAIQNESSSRKKYINSKINQREHLINSLKGQDQAERAMKDLFRQQKKVRKQNAQKMKDKNLHNINRLGDFQQIDNLLEQAILSNKPQQYRRE